MSELDDFSTGGYKDGRIGMLYSSNAENNNWQRYYFKYFILVMN
ncbi:MAG: hypothetical protein ACTHKC_03725 [Candidatus Nitrosocosmicus sp.]